MDDATSPPTIASSADPPRCARCDGPVELPRWRATLVAVKRWPWAARYLPAMCCTACLEHETADEPAVVVAPAGERHRRRLHHSRLPLALHAIQLSELDSSNGRGEIIVALNAWSQHGGGIYLCGPVGTGKTRMAAAAVWAMLEHRQVRWASVPSLTIAYQASFDDVERAQALRTLTGIEALVLDDLGQEHATAASTAQLHAAIDARIAHGAPLLITSNLLPSALGAKHGDWLPSRLAGYCKAYRVHGRDRRLPLDPP